jgi:hypothetical protein
MFQKNKTGNLRITWHCGAFEQQLLQWKSNKYYIFSVCVWSIRHQACNAHAPCYRLWPARLYNIFPPYLINGTIFVKKFMKHKMCDLIFSTNFIWNISHSKNWARYDQNCILVFKQSTRYCCSILMKLKFSRQIFEKYSNIKCYENPFSVSRVIPCGRTDTHDEANSRVSQFCEGA